MYIDWLYSPPPFLHSDCASVDDVGVGKDSKEKRGEGNINWPLKIEIQAHASGKSSVLAHAND